MRVLLDTQIIYLAAAAPDLKQIPRKALAVIEDPEVERCISAASIMEMAIKAETKAIALSESQLRQAVRDLLLTIVPFTPQQAYRLYKMPMHHKDPFDRMIIATALVENIPIVGGDRIFRKYAGLKVIWK
jgi:PIN domain nuclease of toxin-antitoxin system